MLIGDPKQLSPTVVSDAGKDYNLHQSLYSRLYSIFKQDEYKKNRPITMLTTQYRMHSELCQFPSNHFYDACLKTHVSVDQRMAHFPLQPLVVYDLIQSRHEVDANGSSFNTKEVYFIQYFCTMLATDVSIWQSLIAGSSAETSSETNLTTIQLNGERSIAIQQRIAVITPYQAQSSCLRKHLPPEIEVMTIDSSQGSERDIVIISCVRANDSIGFLDDSSRLNVMLTRAKYGLYIFGNLTWLSQHDDYWKELTDDAHKRGILRVVAESIHTLPKRQT
jgi:senataxin